MTAATTHTTDAPVRDLTGWQHLLTLRSDASVVILGGFCEDAVRALAERSGAVVPVASPEEFRSRASGSFSAAVFGPDAGPAAFAAALTVLEPGGSLWVSPAGRQTGHTLRRLGYSGVTTFALLPSAGDSRLLVPVDAGGAVLRAGLGMHAAGTTATRLKKLLYGRVGSLLARRGAGPATACLGFAPGHRLLTTWREATGVVADRRIVPVIRAASPGSGRKAILGGYERDGTPVCFVKVAARGPRADDLAHEVDALSTLGAAGIPGLEVPRVLARGDIGDSSYLTLAPIPFGKRAAPARMPGTVVEALARTFRATEVSETISSSSCWRRFVGAAGGDSLCQQALALVGRRLGNRHGRFGLAHRDFVFWNVWFSDGTIAVLDWEWAESRHIPFQDLFHYHLHGPVNARGLSPIAAAERVLYGPSAHAADAVSQYASATDVPRELSWDYFVLYLVDWLGLQSYLGNADTPQAQGYRALLRATITEERLGHAAWLGGGVAT